MNVILKYHAARYICLKCLIMSVGAADDEGEENIGAAAAAEEEGDGEDLPKTAAKSVSDVLCLQLVKTEPVWLWILAPT